MKSAIQVRKQGRRGVTLIELIIAITLVAAIATGMLTAMHTSLNSLEKTQSYMEENRRTMAVQQAIQRQIGSVIPGMGNCPMEEGYMRVQSFGGTAVSMHFVTAYSFNEGFRGYPKLVELEAMPQASGTIQLVMNEFPYMGTLMPICRDRLFLPLVVTPQSTVLATGLEYVRFSYHERIPGELEQGAWVPIWAKTQLPSAVRIDMAPHDPNPSRLPMMPLHIPIRITRDIEATYADQ